MNSRMRLFALVNLESVASTRFERSSSILHRPEESTGQLLPLSQARASALLLGLLPNFLPYQPRLLSKRRQRPRDDRQRVILSMHQRLLLLLVPSFNVSSVSISFSICSTFWIGRDIVSVSTTNVGRGGNFGMLFPLG